MSAAESVREGLSSSAPGKRARRAVVVGLLLALGPVAGCSANSSTPANGGTEQSGSSATYGAVASASAGLPGPDQAAGMTQPDSAFGQAVIAWDLAGKFLLVTTYGSSSCPNTIDRVVLAGDQRLEFSTSDTTAALATTAPRTCTADLAPFTSSIVVPAGIVRTEPLTVVFQGNEIVVTPQT